MKLKSLWMLAVIWMGTSAVSFAASREVAQNADDVLPMIGDPAGSGDADIEPMTPPPAKVSPRKSVKANPFSSSTPPAESAAVAAPPSDNEIDPNAPASSGHSAFHLGVEGGLSLGTSSFNLNGYSPVISSTVRTGFAGGVFAEYDLSENFSIMPEILYVQKGGRYNTFTDAYQLNWDSLEVPLLVKGKFGTDTVKGVVFAGPALSFAINQTLLDNYISIPPAYYLRTFDIGIHAGLGGEFALTPQMTFFLNGRYMQGFINQSQSFGVTQYLSGFLFMTGLSFGL
jgi:Outer membrane protein beta-barrel domain